MNRAFVDRNRTHPNRKKIKVINTFENDPNLYEVDIEELPLIDGETMGTSIDADLMTEIQNEINSKLNKDFLSLEEKTELEDSDVLVLQDPNSIHPSYDYKKIVFQNLKNQILDMIYPIGSIYMSTDNIDPKIKIGGQWEEIKDKFLLGAGDTYVLGTSGGEATHTLTKNEMPSHRHKLLGSDRGRDSYCYSAGSKNACVAAMPSNDSDANYSHYDIDAYGDVFIQNTGLSQPHNNMPPYYVVKMWKRIA